MGKEIHYTIAFPMDQKRVTKTIQNEILENL